MNSKHHGKSPLNRASRNAHKAAVSSFAVAALCLSAVPGWTQDDSANADGAASGEVEPGNPVLRHIGGSWDYTDRGLEYNPPDSETSLWFGLRMQTRYDTFPVNFDEPDDLVRPSSNDVDIRRARIKGGGTVFADWLEVYSEYDFPSETLLDYRVTATWQGWLSFRAGQWKSEFSRERIDSSGKQQLVERSISNYWFTVDRQRGLAVSGRLAEGSRADTLVYLEYLTGQGLGGSHDSGRGLWLTRLQWNPSGTQLAYSQSDVERRQKPVPSIAFATISGRTPYTRFSSSGGGSLPGFAAGDFDIRQYLLETAVHYRGLGWQQEFHIKRITDRTTGARRDIVGGYAQLGSFLNEWWPAVPRQLELVGRVALVDPDDDQSTDTLRELTLGVNWFINGHRNKITADYGWLKADDPLLDRTHGRFRLQWELSL